MNKLKNEDTFEFETKKIYFIHENTAPIKIDEHWVQIVTNYVLAVGYIIHGRKKCIYGDVDGNTTLINHIPGLVWDSYESGQKQLAKLMSSLMQNYSTEIKDNFDRLKEKYPEMMI